MNLGLPELLVILLFAFLIIGPEKLPQLGRTIGKAIGQFREAQNKVNDGLKKEGLDPQSLQEAAQNPFAALAKVEEIADKAASIGGGGSGQAAKAQGGLDAAGKGAGADGAAGPDAPGAATAPERKVLSLSDKETFAERKRRLQAEAGERGGDASEPSGGKASDKPEGGEDGQA